MKKKWLIPILMTAAIFAAFFIYTGTIYHADAAALAALESDSLVSVSQTGFGWFFDGPSDDKALIFYPGARVEETAYAPLMHRLAEQGLDACLVSMPLDLALFNINEALDIQDQYEYEKWYIGGHSLGGAMAAVCAAEHGEHFSGMILLAAYPTKVLDDHLVLISIYGSEDRVLNMERLNKGRKYEPEHSAEYVIEGGNHCQFGNYGMQRGDGEASISAEEQQEQAAGIILKNI